MKPFYHVMRCVVHGDAVLVAAGITGERGVYTQQVNVGLLGCRAYNGKFRLEPWGWQHGYAKVEDTHKIEIK